MPVHNCTYTDNLHCIQSTKSVDKRLTGTHLLARAHGLVQPIGDPEEHVSALYQRVGIPRCHAGVADATEAGRDRVLVERRGVSAEVGGAIREDLEPTLDHLVSRLGVRVRG